MSNCCIGLSDYGVSKKKNISIVQDIRKTFKVEATSVTYATAGRYILA